MDILSLESQHSSVQHQSYHREISLRIPDSFIGDSYGGLNMPFRIIGCGSRTRHG